MRLSSLDSLQSLALPIPGLLPVLPSPGTKILRGQFSFANAKTRRHRDTLGPKRACQLPYANFGTGWPRIGCHFAKRLQLFRSGYALPLRRSVYRQRRCMPFRITIWTCRQRDQRIVNTMRKVFVEQYCWVISSWQRDRKWDDLTRCWLWRSDKVSAN